MAFSYSNLASWVDVEGTWTAKAVVSNRLASIPGIHEVPIPSGALTIEVPYLYSTPTYRASTCGWTTSGTTTLGSRTVLTAGWELVESLCGKPLKSKVAAYIAAGKDPVEGLTTDLLAEKEKQMAKQSQYLAIQGNTNSGTQNLTFSNGLLYKLDNTYSASTLGNRTASALTSVVRMDTFLSDMSDEMLEMEAIAVCISPANFQALKLDIRQQKYFLHDIEDSATSFSYPGYSNVTIYSIPDMPSTRAFATYPQNIIHAVGVETPLEMHYSKDNLEYRIHAEVYEGWDFHFESLVVRM